MNKAWIVIAALTLSTGSARASAGGEGVRPVPHRPAGAVIHYLGHCGWAVRTTGHLLIFDYQERRDGPKPKVRPEAPALDNGWIDPGEVRGLKVRVFVSHEHQDHYDPVILTWRRQIPDIAYFFGWRAGHDPADHELPGPLGELAGDGMEIFTVNSQHSGVPEVAWLVKVDGLVVYHNGDCQPADAAAAHDHLRARTERIDLAFVPPLHEAKWKYAAQNRDLFRRLSPAAVFPMHATAGDPLYLDFQKAFSAEFPALGFFAPTRMGQRFVYEDGRVRP